jgi:tRNA-uridine 2-sulfurtransferase
VIQIEPLHQTVTVGRKESLEKIGLIAARFNWQSPVPAGSIPCLAQIRAQHRAVPATVEPLEGERARVVFTASQSAITPGQVVTIYQEDVVMGGGWIEGSLDTAPDDAAAMHVS